jgi:hypothetical protein
MMPDDGLTQLKHRSMDANLKWAIKFQKSSSDQFLIANLYRKPVRSDSTHFIALAEQWMSSHRPNLEGARHAY